MTAASKLQPSIGENAMVADFVAVTKNRQAGAYKFAFEVDEQMAQIFLDILGGLPKEGESRPVIIWRPTLAELAAARYAATREVQQIEGKPLKKLTKGKKDEDDAGE